MLARHAQLPNIPRERFHIQAVSHGRTCPARHVLQPAPAASAQTPSSNIPQPSKIRRCQKCRSLVKMLHKHHHSVSPQFWVTALCHLSELVCSRGQQVPLHNWQQLQQCLMYLTEGQEAGKLQQHWQPQQPLQRGDAAQQAFGEVAAAQPDDHHQKLQQLQKSQSADQQGHSVGHQAAQQLNADLLHHHLQEGQSYPQQHLKLNLNQQQQSLAPPISQFTASDVATLLWALGKLRVHLPSRAWPPLLQAAAADMSALSPRDTALLGWSLVKLAAPTPAGWFQQFLDAQAAVLASYPRRSLVLLMYAAARLRCRLPVVSTAAVLAVLQQQLPGMSSRDLSTLLWSLSPLAIKPPAAFMAAAIAASKRQLSSASCKELAALLVGVGRLAYLPPGPWLLELYDQLYWTADQFSLRELCRVVWALGALHLVAVPQELLERLLAFTQHALRQELPPAAPETGDGQAAAAAAKMVRAAAGGQQVQGAQSAAAGAAAAAAAFAWPAGAEYTSSRHSGSKQLAAASKRQYAVSKQLAWLLQGLAGLRLQLSPGQRRTAGTSWLMLVVAADGPGSHVLLPACLHACVLLGVMLPPHCCAAVVLRLWQLRGKMSHGGLALGLWGAVRLGCRPDKDWLAVWLGESEQLLDIACVSEINMLLDACGRLGHVPQSGWLQGVCRRLGQQVAVTSANTMAETLRCLLVLEKAAAAAAAAGGPVAAATAPQAAGAAAGAFPSGGVLAVVPPSLLYHMSARIDQLEGQRASPFAVQRFQQHAARITAMLKQQQQQLRQQQQQQQQSRHAPL